MPRKSDKKRVAANKKKNSKKTVKPIPSGFRSVTSYLIVNDANAAIEFYKKAFGAKEISKNASPSGKIINAQIKIGDSIVMLADEFPGSPMRSPLSLGASTITLHIYSKNVDKLWAQATSAGAKVLMPLDNQFWGDRYGQIVDPFGHSWSLAQHIYMNPKEMEEKQKAAMAMFNVGEHPSFSDKPPPSGVA